MTFSLAYLVWDPNPAMFDFKIPLLNRPLLWYGFFFALAFFAGYQVLTFLLKRTLKQGFHKKTAEELTFYVLIGTLIGARLGDVIFYQNWAEIARDPFSIIAVWNGGLASHGGAVGILIALWLFARKKKMSFWLAVDWTVIPATLAAVFIRIGNFFNQEILGIPTTLPWGIVFLHPADFGPITPRHPVQLYEAVGYLCIFLLLFLIWQRKFPFKPIGKITGLFLVLVFGFRFVMEYLKVEQSAHLSQTALLTMGQILSLPFIILGAYLSFRKNCL